MSFLKIGRGQRVGQPDFQFAVFDSIRDAVNNVLEQVIVGRENYHDGALQKDFILQGFDIISDGVGGVAVTGGVALLGFIDRGAVRRHALVVDIDSRKEVDISSFDDATYTVWVRAAYRDSNYAARPHWNPLASPNPIEYVRNVATRFASSWDMKVELASPGDEWTAVGTIEKNTGVYTPTPQQLYLFEGRPHATTAWKLDDTDWGASGDRDSNRAVYGIGGLRAFSKMLMRQIQDIVGGDTHVANPQAGSATTGSGPRSLTQLNSEKLARTGGTNSPMIGDLLPSPTATHSLGLTGSRWLKLWAGSAELTSSLTAVSAALSGALTAASAAISGALTAASVTANTVTANNNGATPANNTLYGTNVPKAHGRIAIGIGSPAIQAGSFNLDSISYSGASVNVDLDLPLFSDADIIPFVQLIGSTENLTFSVDAAAGTGGRVTISATTADTGVARDLSAGPALELALFIIGRQTT